MANFSSLNNIPWTQLLNIYAACSKNIKALKLYKCFINLPPVTPHKIHEENNELS